MGKLDIVSLVIVAATVIFVLRISHVKNKVVQKVLDWFPAILFAYVIPALFTHSFGLDLSQGTIHSLSMYLVIPIALLSVMSALSFKQLAMVGIKPIILFVAGSALIAILPVLLVNWYGTVDAQSWELFMEDSYWKGLAPIVGGWIGGSTSQLILKELAQTPENLFLSVLVLDNILVNIWTFLMFQFIKKGEKLSLVFKIKDELPESLEVNERNHTKALKPIFVGIIFLGFTGITYVLDLSFLNLVIVLSILGLILGNFVSNWNTRFSLQLGAVAIVLVMAILGLRLDFNNLSLPWTFINLVIVWLFLHFIGMVLVAKLLGINLIWVPIASMANLGGISTAPAVTAAYRKDLMPHAVLLAILSMVTGTAWGLLTIYLFQLV
ncbi:DUF819 family protein [Algoriphagus sp. CAU 1675]|nr:DUF819 family protein [Algoriphagus sp. CAU 1675]